MKVIIEHEGMRAVVEDESVVDICDAIDLCEKALLKAGFQRVRVQGGFLQKARDIQEAPPEEL